MSRTKPSPYHANLVTSATSSTNHTNGSTANTGATALTALSQRARETFVLNKRRDIKPSYSVSRLLVEDEESVKKAAVTTSAFIQHCEAQMAAALFLRSPSDYAHWLRLLVQSLVKKGDERHLETIFDALKPPDKTLTAALGLTAPLQTSILDLDKVALLRSLMRLVADNRALQGLVLRYQAFL